jgi:hypothetical protein
VSNERFDAMLAALAGARTRREMLAAVAVAATADSALNAVPATAQSNGCRGITSRCKQDGHCCSGRCRKRRGKKKGRCRCSTKDKRCLETRDCCDGELELVCDEGFCVPEVQD